MHLNLFQETAYFQAGMKYVQNDPEILLRNQPKICEVMWKWEIFWTGPLWENWGQIVHQNNSCNRL